MIGILLNNGNSPDSDSKRSNARPFAAFKVEQQYSSRARVQLEVITCLINALETQSRRSPGLCLRSSPGILNQVHFPRVANGDFEQLPLVRDRTFDGNGYQPEEVTLRF